MPSRILTPANQITILRMAFVPFFAILVVDQRYRGALAVLTAAALTDMIDGIVARLLKQETPLGVALDPIADKLLMTTAYLTLAFREALPWWLTIMVISRDLAIIIPRCSSAWWRATGRSIPLAWERHRRLSRC